MRDVIVIGSGGGGPVIATELAAQGLDVLILEAGPNFDDPEKQFSRLENDANNPVSGYLRWGPADRSTPPWSREFPQAGVVLQVAGVGGTTLHYYANSPRAMPGVFSDYAGRDRGAYDHRHPFPFPYRELIPYYEWVEHRLPVQTAAMATKDELFFEGAEGIGLPLNRSKDIRRASFRPQENAILQPRGTAGRTSDSHRLRYPEARGCTLCGLCFQGCNQPRRAPRNLKAKRSTDNSYVPMALTADRWARGGRAAELRPNSFVTQILSETRGSRTVARGVRWRNTATGEVSEERSRVVVLAGGCNEDPRLWLNSGLPNPNGWVGRGYTTHMVDLVVGRFDRYTGGTRGSGSSARADFPGRGMLENMTFPPGLQSGSMQMSESGIRHLYDRDRAATSYWDGPAGRVVGREAKAMLSEIDQIAGILVSTDDDVEPHNRVVRSTFPADEHGPIPKVILPPGRRSRRTIDNREFLARRAADLLRAAGAKQVVRIDWPALVVHLQSTMRMGHDAADSVLRPTGEARFVSRLYIASNAALPNALGGPNPTLTTQALATRTAEKLARRHFGLEPWVEREAPVRSIDDRVTRAVLARGL